MTTLVKSDAIRPNVYQVDLEYTFGKSSKMMELEWDGENPLEIPIYGDETTIKIVAIRPLE